MDVSLIDATIARQPLGGLLASQLVAVGEGLADILTALAPRAREILKLVASHQLKAAAETEGDAGKARAKSKKSKRDDAHAMEYNAFRAECKGRMIVQASGGEQQLKVLLGELRDHRVLKQGRTGPEGRDALWVPGGSREVLERIIDGCSSAC